MSSGSVAGASVVRTAQFLSGNSAIAHGIVEAGAAVATAYPGTPSTEILEDVARYKKLYDLPIYVEWSVNEKIAFDIAYATAITGKRAAVSMKQVGLNVASDSLLSAAYTGVVGGLVLISCDDPGPHSSQTEQDTRLFSIFAKVPALDPATPQEALEMVKYAFDLSERYGIPVIVRPTTRLCHGLANVNATTPEPHKPKAAFKKNAARWAATPAFRIGLHKELEEKLKKIREEFETAPFNSADDDKSSLGIIASGVAYATVRDILEETGTRIPILKIGTVHPLPLQLVERFIARFKKVLVIEEPDRAIEIQIRNRTNVLGRETGHVPTSGELVPEVVYEIIRTLAALPEQKIPDISFKTVAPTLCPGCGHRSAFFAIRKANMKGIFPSDIGCYTLGINMGAVDTCLDMGAGITIADGISKSYAQDGECAPVIATIGDSTFFHAGIPALLNAVVSKSAFVLVILDNDIVAMTGHQPTPASGIQADRRAVGKASLRELVKACGVEFIQEIDAYEVKELSEVVKKAREYARTKSKVAVLIAKHPCVLIHPNEKRVKVTVTDECNGCEYCLKFFECPALKMDAVSEKVYIDRSVCVDCGECVDACPTKMIVEQA